MTVLRTGNPRNKGSIAGRGDRPDQIWALPSLLFNENLKLIPGDKAAEAWNCLPRLRMSETWPSQPYPKRLHSARKDNFNCTCFHIQNLKHRIRFKGPSLLLHWIVITKFTYLWLGTLTLAARKTFTIHNSTSHVTHAEKSNWSPGTWKVKIAVANINPLALELDI